MGSRAHILSKCLALVWLAIVSGCDDLSDVGKCETQVSASVNSPDLAYSAKTKKEICVSGAEVQYFVVVEGIGKNVDHWFVELRIENDLRGGAQPKLSWAGPRNLVIEIDTRTLQGDTQLHLGDDLTVKRKFVPRDPFAFPNFF